MGMAASQARYLALVARKSNCEYEGQQINQARTALSNQSANLFNQLLGLTVPVPPSTQDYTTTQYSYSDGINSSVISSWQQLSSADPDYNYVVTHYYYADRYTGSQKKLSDPQVQFPESASSITEIKAAERLVASTKSAYEAATTANTDAQENLKNLQDQLNKLISEAATLTSYSSQIEGINTCTYDEANNTYSLTNTDGNKTYIGYDNLSDAEKASVDQLIQDLIDQNALNKSYSDNKSGLYFSFDGDDFTFAMKNDLDELVIACGLGGTTADESLTVYDSADTSAKLEAYKTQIATYQPLVDLAQTTAQNTKTDLETTKQAYEEATEAYNNLSHPTYIGNSELTPLATLDDDQKAEINQIVADMKEQGIDASICDCFDSDGNYTGGIYSFKLNGTTYYTTYADLENSYASGTGNNNIDGQVKMAYYNATYVSTKVEETEKALLETDGSGRFTSVRFENDTITYTLNMETVTDEAAYQDAMNQYYYDNAVYDKTVQDINAKTSIIQQEDLQLELRLKQLDTEQSALSTEMEAVKKVVDDNVEDSFKTFSS